MASANDAVTPATRHVPSVVEMVREVAITEPDAVALIDGSDPVSFRQLADCITAIAVELRERGIQPGDRVLLRAASAPSYVAAYLAVHLARGIAVPIDPTTPDSRRDWIAHRVSARRELDVRDQEEMMARARARHGAPWQEAPPSASDIADIMFTSGTTGDPKGVALTQANLAIAARHIRAFIGMQPGDVEVLPLPLCHAFGLGSIRSTLCAGATLVLIDGFAFPGRILSALEDHGATGFRCVPAGLVMMLRFGADRLGQLRERIRYVEIGSAPMRAEDKQALMSLLPRTRICMHYGLTEAARSAFIEFHESRDRLHSIGRPADGVEIRITGDDGKRAETGAVGEIWIRGAHVMSEYWRDEQRTQNVLVDGWLRTGDMARADEQGYIYLQGRTGDLVNVGGRKVSPAEIEEVLRAHPAVQDVACCAIPDATGLSEEAVGAIVVLREDREVAARELRNYLRGRLEHYMIPQQWLFAGSLPRTANGKIQRHLVRAQLETAASSARVTPAA